MIVIAISGLPQPPFPTTNVAMFLDPKLVKWKSSGNVKILLNTTVVASRVHVFYPPMTQEAP